MCKYALVRYVYGLGVTMNERMLCELELMHEAEAVCLLWHVFVVLMFSVVWENRFWHLLCVPQWTTRRKWRHFCFG